MTAALDGPGTPEYLIAAYGGTETGAIRVISLAQQPPSLVAENDLAGRLPELEALDVDADGKPEIVASFDFGRGGSRTCRTSAAAALRIRGRWRFGRQVRGVVCRLTPSLAGTKLRAGSRWSNAREKNPPSM